MIGCLKNGCQSMNISQYIYIYIYCIIKGRGEYED